MDALVLSARPALETNLRLRRAARDQGLELVVRDALQVIASAGGEEPARLMTSPGEPALALPRVVLARVGNWRPESLLAQLEVAMRANVATPNPASAIRVGRDHWQTVDRLAAAGLPVPRTLAGADPERLAAAARELGLPVVVKVRRSRMGVGVIRCDTRDHLDSVLDSLWRVGDELIVQAYVECAGSSLRLLVVGDRVVAACRFEAAPGEWRSNGARGGVAHLHEPSAGERDLALRAAAAVGLGICGVDLLPADDGVVVAEVNPTPGFLRLEQATGRDVARAIVRHLALVAGL